jgi:hypothetical protein
MKATLLSIALVAAAGLCFTLALAGCSSGDLGSSSSSVSGVGDTCVQDGDCNATLECEHGTCQPHDRNDDRADAGRDDDDDEPGDDDDDEHAAPDGGVQVACQVDTDCAGGQECDDGFCKAHGGDDGGDDGSHG